MGEKTSGLFRVIVTFHDLEGAPLAGAGWRVKLYDKDPVDDGLLAEARLDANGEASMMFSVADVKSWDSPGERKPDLYFKLLRDKAEIWRSEVFPDVDFEELDPVSGRETALTQAFGPFRVAT